MSYSQKYHTGWNYNHNYEENCTNIRTKFFVILYENCSTNCYCNFKTLSFGYPLPPWTSKNSPWGGCVYFLALHIGDDKWSEDRAWSYCLVHVPLGGCVTDVLTTFWCFLWFITEQTHWNIFTFCECFL